MKTEGTAGIDEQISPPGLIESYATPAGEGMFSDRLAGKLWWALAGVVLIGTVVHVTVLTTIFSPGFIATDSGSFLTQYSYGYDCPNNWRMVPVPLLFAGLMRLFQGNIFSIVLPQLIFALIAIVLAVRVAAPRSRWSIVIISACAIVIFTPRSFVFHYWVLSESLYISMLALFIAFAFRAIANPKQIVFIVLMVVSAACLLAIRPTGMLFVAAAGLICLYRFVRRLWNPFPLLILAMLVGGIFCVNKAYRGNFVLSRHTHLQLLITANKYIQWDTPFMSDKRR